MKKKHKRYGDGLRHLSIKTLEQWQKEPVDSPGEYYLQCEVERVLIRKSRKWRKRLGKYYSTQPWKKERNYQKKISEQKKKNNEKSLKVNYKLRTVEVVVENDARFGPTYEYRDEWYPTCRNCGTSLSKGYQYCPTCGCGIIWVKAPPLPRETPEYEEYRKEQERKRVEDFNQFKLLIKELKDLHNDEGDNNERN